MGKKYNLLDHVILSYFFDFTRTSQTRSCYMNCGTEERAKGHVLMKLRVPGGGGAKL